ncbi:hypothetical protein [Sphingobacterium pedocola]|uniref:Glycoside hydrolase family 5 domain-containing protein n=1 Tax=Sphingobacterium pedocola TaxID=2082722 RepID=A0ABR9T420_9SPHI|nr:hypothetical protein [Sphingobacterium pedocola]MBE8719407.1 hypothetical protein [Sphingobacterium pedocola]
MKLNRLNVLIGLAFLLLMGNCSNKSEHPEPQPPEIPDVVDDGSILFGIVEPLWEVGNPDPSNNYFQVRGFDLDKAANLVGAIGAQSFRLMINNGTFENGEGYNEQLVSYYKSAIKKLKNNGVKQIIGMCMVFPNNSGFVPDSPYSAPRINDKDYGKWLSAVADTWTLIAKTFPEIEYWEMGNEFNANVFYHPNGFDGAFGSEGTGGFTRAELIQQNVNYMYYASRGIKRGNPNTKTIMPGYSPGTGGLGSGDLRSFMTGIYDLIRSGDYPFGAASSKDPNDYFENLGWHPYVNTGGVNGDWVNANNQIYEISTLYGDQGKAVFFTEFGFTDYGDGNTEIQQIKDMETAFNYIKTDMSYVKNMTAFRLFECEFANQWGGKGEVHFGYFREPSQAKGFSPKAKAYALQAIYNGKGDLTQYE